jgi:uncharacterized membrane protein
MMGYRGYGYYGNMMGGGWFGGLLMLFFSALVVAGFVILVLWAVWASSGGHTVAGGVPRQPGAAGHDEAVSIAKRRLASGEITKEQYDEIMRTLGG